MKVGSPIRVVKEALAGLMGVQSQQLSLSFQNRQLDDGVRLALYGGALVGRLGSGSKEFPLRGVRGGHGLPVSCVGPPWDDGRRSGGKGGFGVGSAWCEEGDEATDVEWRGG